MIQVFRSCRNTFVRNLSVHPVLARRRPTYDNDPDPEHAPAPIPAPDRVREYIRPRARVHMHPPPPIVETKKALSVAKLNAPCEEPCGICFEVHLVKDTLRTDCNHHFCKDQYLHWININNNANNKTCPTCRKIRPAITTYRQRAQRAQRLANPN